jgi:mannonate dehydratase
VHRRELFATLGTAALGARTSGAAPARPPLRLKLGCQEGPTTDERLRFFSRHGVRNICGSFDKRGAGPYKVAELTELRERCEKQGISLDLVRLPFLRPSNVDRDDRAAIVLGQSPQRDRDIEEVITTLQSCARAGIPAVTYNLTLLGYQRSHTVRGRGDIDQAAWRLDRASKALTRAGRVDADQYWERIDYFLARVVPAANEHRVRLCCHPHDPPTPPGFRGVDAVLGTVDGLKKFVALHQSPYHGLNFCQGTVAEMLTDPIRQLPEVIRYFGTRGKIFNVHFRNIRGRRDDFVETFPDDGELDLPRLFEVYREVGYPYLLMPDHVPKHADDPDERQAMAFCYGYIRALIQGAAAEGRG